ncbi:MAG TPA: type II secretion system F family protein, partial [Candidatus Deferrimicrobiaceae bacterium]
TALALTGSAAAALIGGILPLLLSGMAVRAFRSRRKARILSRLPSLLDLLAGHMKAGHSLPSSLAETVPLLPPGIREEMGWVLQQARLGTPVADSLLAWEKRLGAEEVSLFVRPLRAALPGGVNVAELLEQTRDILRMRARMQEKLRSMTAQARLQAVVLTLLPPCFAAALSCIDPGYLPVLFGTLPGKAILVVVFFLLVAGWLVIRRILSTRP